MPEVDEREDRCDAQPKVAILLCTYHGQHYLAEQLDSFTTQIHTNWEVWASDDGSKDDTRAILEAYQQQWLPGRLSIHCGPAKGCAANFLSLVCKAGIEADYYAYSDQDDTWERDHLSRALDCLKAVPADTPALYCSRTRYMSPQGADQGCSTLFNRNPGFRNALVQSIAGGNTMVFNRAARELLAKTSANIHVTAHDWWTYMLMSGCGARIIYDPYPGVRYRQHDHNLTGQNVSVGARLLRAKGLLTGQFKGWNDINVKALHEVEHFLTNENQEVLAFFNKARKGSILSRIKALYRSGIYRQNLSGNLGILTAAVLNKL